MLTIEGLNTHSTKICGLAESQIAECASVKLSIQMFLGARSCWRVWMASELGSPHPHLPRECTSFPGFLGIRQPKEEPLLGSSRL